MNPLSEVFAIAEIVVAGRVKDLTYSFIVSLAVIRELKLRRPPVGICLNAFSAIFKPRIGTIFKTATPFWAADLKPC